VQVAPSVSTNSTNTFMGNLLRRKALTCDDSGLSQRAQKNSQDAAESNNNQQLNEKKGQRVMKGRIVHD
jgi:hypothetical protein